MGSNSTQIQHKLKSCIQVSWKNRILVVDLVVLVYAFIRHFHISLYEQYYYFKFGQLILQNTSFVFPSNSFCVSSDLINNSTGNSDSYVTVEKKSNDLVIYGQIASRIPMIVTTVLLGTLTDKLGRKFGIILPVVGMVLDGISSTLIVWFDTSPYYMILVHGLHGFLGGHPLLFSSVYAYIADVSSPKWRVLRLGIVAASVAFGGGAGGLSIGYWLDGSNCNFTMLFLFYTGVGAALLAYVIIIPESLPKAERAKLASKNPKGARIYLEGARLFCGGLSIRSTWKLYVGAIVIVAMHGSFSAVHHIDVFFLKAPPFDFSPHKIGIFQFLRETSEGVALSAFLAVLIGLKVNDIIIIVLALVVHVVGSILIGISNKAWQLYTIVSVKGVEFLSHPAAQGYLSKLIKPEKQGALFSVLSSLCTISELIADTFWPLIFPLTLQYHLRSGTVYILMGVIGSLLLPMVISLFFLKKEEEEDSSKEEEEKQPNGYHFSLQERSVKHPDEDKALLKEEEEDSSKEEEEKQPNGNHFSLQKRSVKHPDEDKALLNHDHNSS